MEKIYKAIEKELEEIGEQGFNTSNIEVAGKLSEIRKNLKESESGEGEKMRRYSDYNDYMDGGYGRSYRDGGDYGRRGVPGSGRGNYRDGGYRDGNYMDGGYGHHGRFDDKLDRLADCVEMYEYARGRYRDGGSEERMTEGLEKVMYAVCMFVESAMDFAESPKEKEIIRKHIQKLQNI